MLGRLGDGAAERFEDGAAFRRRDMQPAEPRHPLGAQQILAAPLRLGARHDDLGRLAAAQFEDQPGRDFEARPDKGRVDAALEAVARVAGDLEPAPGRGGADRIEEGRLDKDLGRRLGAPGRLAADHAAEALHPGRVGDRGDFRVELVFAAVQREQLFAGPGEAHGQVAGELAGVEHMQRPVEVEGHEIGDVDEGRDRPQPDRFEAVAQPARARPVLQAADMAAEKQRAGGQVLEMDGDRRAEAALDRGRVERLELPHAGRGKVAGDAAHAEAIGPVRRHLEVDDRVVEPQQAGVPGADRRILRQFDDAGVILAQRQFGRRHQHAPRRDAADRAFAQHRAGFRDMHAGWAEHPLHPGPRVGGAAHHLHLGLAGVDDTDPEAVGVGMRLGRDDARHDKAGEPRSPVRDAFDVVAEHDEALGDGGDRRLGVEMGLEPREGRLHAAPPPERGPRTGEGMSSGTNP